MTLKNKLFLGFSLILILMTLVVSISITMLQQQNKEMNEIVLSRYEKTRLANEIDIEHTAIGNRLQRVLLDPAGSAEEAKDIEESNRKLFLALETLSHMKMTEEERAIVANMQMIIWNCGVDVNELLALTDSGKREEAIKLYLTKHMDSRREFRKQCAAFEEIQKNYMTEVVNSSSQTYYSTVKLISSFLGLALIIGIATTLWIIRVFSNSMSRVLNVIKGVSEEGAQGLQRIEVISKDEIGAISLAYNKMVETIEHKSQQEKKYIKTLRDQNWIEVNLNEFIAMFHELRDFATLASTFITKITPQIEANYGLFYLAESDDQAQVLKPLAAYASDGEVGLPAKSFRLGEGLVGQCARDQQDKIIRDLPLDYLKIRSGLGEGSPNFLYLFPIKFGESILGVLEFASFKEMESHHHHLLKRAINLLGIKMYNLAGQIRVQELLEESQAMTEELRAQSEELQTQSEELQMQHEELKSMNEQLEQQYRDSEAKTQELEKAKKQLEELAQQLCQQSQYKTEFLANMSHELRTPMNSMLILAQILSENKEGNLTDKQIDYAHTIYEAGKDLLDLINDILDLSKIELGKMEVSPSVVRLPEVLKNLEMEFSTIALRRELYFHVESELEPGATLVSDEQRMLQIIRNLLYNAIKFTEEGGVTLKFHQLREDKALTVTVIDTGIGIPKDKQAIIFEAFRQADGTISRKHGGSGLGLSIAKDLTNLLGGTLEVESQVGVGSTFTLRLPPLTLESSVAQPSSDTVSQPSSDTATQPSCDTVSQLVAATAPENPLPRETTLHLEGKNVLIVDDDMRNIFALTTLLEAQNMNVIFAENGKEALETLKTFPDVDIILMDIMMPELDGYTTMQAIRSIPEYKDLPIIALTAKAMKNDRIKCLEAGASDYISKPIRVEQLLSLLQVWLFARRDDEQK